MNEQINEEMVRVNTAEALISKIECAIEDGREMDAAAILAVIREYRDAHRDAAEMAATLDGA